MQFLTMSFTSDLKLVNPFSRCNRINEDKCNGKSIRSRTLISSWYRFCGRTVRDWKNLNLQICM